jgi:integrase
VRAIIARRADQAGLGNVGAHDMRRTFADLLDTSGVDLKGIQAAMRHASPAVTATCYLDRSPRRAVEATAELFI